MQLLGNTQFNNETHCSIFHKDVFHENCGNRYIVDDSLFLANPRVPRMHRNKFLSTAQSSERHRKRRGRV